MLIHYGLIESQLSSIKDHSKNLQGQQVPGNKQYLLWCVCLYTVNSTIGSIMSVYEKFHEKLKITISYHKIEVQKTIIL